MAPGKSMGGIRNRSTTQVAGELGPGVYLLGGEVGSETVGTADCRRPRRRLVSLLRHAAKGDQLDTPALVE
jgi:hypothetical protein